MTKRLYAETNFLLEIAFEQEEHASCSKILGRARAGDLALVLPAYSLVEAFEALHRRTKERQHFATQILKRELRELHRTASFASETVGDELTSLLIKNVQEAKRRLQEVTNQVQAYGRTIPLDQGVVERAREQADAFGLSIQDATVLASILADLQAYPMSDATPACFVTRNDRDFDDRGILALLSAHHCRVVFQFRATQGYLPSS